MLQPLREVLELDPSTDDAEVVEQALVVIRSLTELATQQAGELVRKDAVLDRVIATARDGLRVTQDPPDPSRS